MTDGLSGQTDHLDDSLGQPRLLRRKLRDTLAEFFIATLAGCVFVSTASKGDEANAQGPRPAQGTCVTARQVIGPRRVLPEAPGVGIRRGGNSLNVG